eukprot:3194494-Prymnesium_polylepis.2
MSQPPTQRKSSEVGSTRASRIHSTLVVKASPQHGSSSCAAPPLRSPSHPFFARAQPSPAVLPFPSTFGMAVGLAACSFGDGRGPRRLFLRRRKTLSRR